MTTSCHPLKVPLIFRKSTNSNSSPSGQKRKRDDTSPPQNKTLQETPKVSRKSPPPPIASATPKKSVSLNEYKKRKNTSSSATSPLTPTLPKTQPPYAVDSPHPSDKGSTKPKGENLDANAFADKSQRYEIIWTTADG